MAEKGAGSEPTDISMVSQNEKLLKLKKQLSSIKLMDIFSEDFLNVASKLFLSLAYVASDFVRTINVFLTTFEKEVNKLSHHVF